MPNKFLDADTSDSDDRDYETAQIFESFENINQTNILSNFSKLQSSMELDSITNFQQTSPNQSPTDTVNANSLSANSISIPNINPCTSIHSHPKNMFDPLQFHFNRPNCVNKNNDRINKIRSYIQNALSAFIKSCLNTRKKFLEEFAIAQSNTQIAQFTTNPNT